MLVRLTRKLAEQIDGVDLSHNDVGTLMELPDRKAHLLIAEGWALEDRRLPFLGRRDMVVAFRRANDPGPLRLDEADYQLLRRGRRISLWTTARSSS
jgi:hypothetical protein